VANKLETNLILAPLAGFALILVLWSTPHGVGLRPDSFDYLSAAENFARGDGLGRWTGSGEFRPLTHFPPLYPMMIGMLRLAGMDILAAARLGNAVLFGALIVLAWVAVRLMSGSATLALLASIIVATSDVLIYRYSMALSEPLFLVLALGGSIALAQFLRRGSLPSLAVSSILFALASLTRYMGLTFLLAGWILILIQPRAARRQKLGASLAYLSVALLPLVWWWLRNLALTGNPVDRALAFHFPTSSNLKMLAISVFSWLFPEEYLAGLSRLPLLLLDGFIVLLTGGLILWMFSGKLRKDGLSALLTGLELVLLVGAASYSTALLISLSFVDRLTPLDNRILAPLYLNLGLLVMVGLSRLWSRIRRAGRILVAAACGTLIFAHAVKAQAVFGGLRSDGQGYASLAWQNSPTMTYVTALPPVPIYTNDIVAVYFLGGRVASFIPTDYNPATDTLRTDYPEWLATMRRRMLKEDAVLVLFGPDPLPIDPEQLAQLTEGLKLVERFQDGAVYRH